MQESYSKETIEARKTESMPCTKESLDKASLANRGGLEAVSARETHECMKKKKVYTGRKVSSLDQYHFMNTNRSILRIAACGSEPAHLCFHIKQAPDNQ